MIIKYCEKNIPSCIDVEYFVKAFKFFYKKLELGSNLTINLSFIKMKDKGSTNIKDFPASPPKKFLIEFSDRLSSNWILRVLAHELGHVKQYSEGKKIDISRTKIWFNNNFHPFDEHNRESYLLSPWEIEAVGYQENLYRLFKEEGHLDE
jgi:hypothetical protein